MNIYYFKSNFCLFFYLSFIGYLHGQDTVRYNIAPLILKEHVVTERQYHPVPGIKYEKIDSLYFQIFQHQSLAHTLEFATGAYIKTYGNGTSSTISFRGTGPEKTNFLWNGFQINSGSLGLMDLSLLSVNTNDEIQIAYGSASTLFGNASMGATILLNSFPDYQQPSSFEVSVEGGSFETFSGRCKANINSERFSSSTSLNYSQSKNNFYFRNYSKPGFPWEQMNNASYQKFALQQDLSYLIGKNAEISVMINYNRQFRGIPPAIGSADLKASQFDQNIRAMSTIKWFIGKNRNLFSQAGVGYFYDELNYIDQNINDSTHIHQLQSYLIQKWNGWKKVKLDWGIHYQLWLPSISQYAKNVNEHRFSVVVNAIYHPFSWLSMSYGVRQQFAPGYQPPMTGLFGTEWKIINKKLTHLSLNTMVNNGYRIPTLNDRYWTPGGNPDLLPEFSWNIEGGYKLQLDISKKLKWEISSTGFVMWINNWIAWQPNDLGYWSPVNYTSVRNSGVESSVQFSGINNGWKWSTQVQHTYVHSRDLSNVMNTQIIYVPYHTINVMAMAQFKGFWITAISKFTSDRFIRTDESMKLNAYARLDISLGKQIRFKKMDLKIMINGLNVTNTMYQTIENRPLSGVQINGSVIFNIKPFISKSI